VATRRADNIDARSCFLLILFCGPSLRGRSPRVRLQADQAGVRRGTPLDRFIECSLPYISCPFPRRMATHPHSSVFLALRYSLLSQCLVVAQSVLQAAFVGDGRDQLPSRCVVHRTSTLNYLQSYGAMPLGFFVCCGTSKPWRRCKSQIAPHQAQQAINYSNIEPGTWASQRSCMCRILHSSSWRQRTLFALGWLSTSPCSTMKF
jgi:hypothetical protein